MKEPRIMGSRAAQAAFPKFGTCQGCGTVGQLGMVQLRPMWDHDTTYPGFIGPVTVTDIGFCIPCTIMKIQRGDFREGA